MHGIEKCYGRVCVGVMNAPMQAFNLEPDGGGLTCSLVEPTLAQLKAA